MKTHFQVQHTKQPARPIRSKRAAAGRSNALPRTTLRSVDHVAQRLAPATCGELMQGCLDGQDFLVNCPIDRYAMANVCATESPGFKLHQAGKFGKVQHALDLLDELIAQSDQFFHRPVDIRRPGLEMRLHSDIPRGKGMASSSADLAAALTAACDSYDISLSPQQLSSLIARVEPSDHVHLSGISHVDHLGGAIFDSLPAPDDLSVLVVDCGGEVDTVEFDREHARRVYKQEQSTLSNALQMLKQGLLQRDPTRVAIAATTSALLNQRILPKAQFEDLLACSKEQGALGLNCAHSGTVLGVLYRSSDDIGHRIWQHVERQFGDSVNILGSYRIVSGGCRVC